MPSDRFDAAMTDLARLGRLQDSSRKTQDVTTEVIDVDQQVRAQRVGLRRLEVLLGRASSLSSLLKVEREVTRRQGDLDSLRSQRTYLANQTSLATITVQIDRTARPAPRHPEHSGFGAGLGAGWHGLKVFVTGVLTAVGAVLPFTVAVLVLLPGWAVLRLVRRRRSTVTATAE